MEVIKNLFMQEIITLKAHPQNEQMIIGNKLTVIEIELKKLIKELDFIEIGEDATKEKNYQRNQRNQRN